MNKDGISKRVIFFVFLLINLAACGGGGGSAVEPEPVVTTMQGTVTKGIIKGAVVDVYSIDGGVVSSAVLVSTTTGSTGSYSVIIPSSYSGPVLIEMHNNAANGATMTCDVPLTGCSGYGFGADMPLGGLVLRTYVSNVSAGSAQSASVTPMTTMAAAYAEDLAAKGANLDAETIAKANSKVSNLLGINNIVLTTAPDITGASASSATKNELKYAYLSAAMLSIAQASFGGDIKAAIDALLASYIANEGELISNESMNTAQVISLADLAFQAAMIAKRNDKTGDAYNDLWDLYQIAFNPAKTNKPTETMPSPTSGLGELETVKAFITDVRTWGNVIKAETRAKTDAFRVQTDAAGLIYDVSGPLLGDALRNAVKVAAQVYVSGTKDDIAPYFLGQTPSVTATGSAILTGTVVSVVGEIDGVSVNVQIDFPVSLTASSFIATVNTAVIEDTQVRLEISSGSVSLDYGTSSVDITPWLEGKNLTDLPDPDSGSMNLAATITEIGGVPDPLTLSGSLNLTIVGSKNENDVVIRDGLNNVVQYNPESLSFAGSVSNTTGDSYSVSFGATMPNAATFMPLPPLKAGVHKTVGSYSFSNSGNSITIVEPYITLVYDWNSETKQVTVNETSTGGYHYSFEVGSYDSLNVYLAGYHRLYNFLGVWVADEGSYQIVVPTNWAPAGGELDAILLWPATGQPEENTTNFRDIRNISISLTAKLTGLPEAKFTLTGDRTGFNDGNGMMTISYGGRRMELSALVVEGNATGDFTITNQDGAKLVLNFTENGDVSAGSLTYDGKEYATLSEVNGVGILRYIDGSFETL